MNFYHHTKEDCDHYCRIQEKSAEISRIAEKYKDAELAERVKAYNKVIKGELDKYSNLIGYSVFVQDTGNSFRKGIINNICAFSKDDIIVGVKFPGDNSAPVKYLSNLSFCLTPTRDGNDNQEKP